MQGWGGRVPEMLDGIRTAEDVYFDSINRVQVGRWSRNRVVLVGDAAGCVTVFGEGSSAWPSSARPPSPRP